MQVSGKRNGVLGAELSTTTHSILSGVPTKLGGQDEAMDPHELLQAALAACTVITVQMYANRKQWPLESTDVQIIIESENKEQTIIRRDVKFVGALDNEQRERLLDIANKCPIHHLLQSNVTINTNMST